MSNNLTYHREGNYLFPDVIPPASPNIGVWGMRRKNYLMKNKKPFYTGLLLTGELNAHLEEIDRSANEMFELLVRQYANREGITEVLKAKNQMEWVRKMNSVKASAEEVVYSCLISN